MHPTKRKMKENNKRQEKYDVEEMVFTEMLPKIFYRSAHMTYKNMMEKGGKLLAKSLNRCYKELNLESPFVAEDFKFLLHTVEDDLAGEIQLVVVAINPKKAKAMKKIILRYGRDHEFMSYKRYLFVIADRGSLCFCATPREHAIYYSEAPKGTQGYYVFDMLGYVDDEDDEEIDSDYEPFLYDDEEMCALGDYSHCASGCW